MSAVDPQTVSKLRKFVEELSDVVDIQFSDDPSLPKLPVDPRDKSNSTRTAHHMLLVASVDQRALVGVAENARRLLVHCYEKLGENLYLEGNLDSFATVLREFRSPLPLGKSNHVMPHILASANRFVATTAEGDLVRWARNFNSPSSIVDAIASNIAWMGATPNSTRKKAWMYMRWMVRPYPDLRIWENLSPKDLFVPVDINVAKAASLFGIMPRESLKVLDWSDVVTITNFARTLFPGDPAKIDYPFFLLGRGDLKARRVALKLGLTANTMNSLYTRS